MAFDLGVPLLNIVEADLGPSMRREGAGGQWWLCPFHGDGNPSLHITPDQQHFACFGCFARGDAVDYLKARFPDCKVSEALKSLGFSPSWGKGRPPRTPRTTGFGVRGGLAFLKGPPDAEWQAEAREFVMRCKRKLWSKAGRKALDWLHARGLRDETIKAARLGYSGYSADRSPVHQE